MSTIGNPKRSHNARAVAYDVIEKVRNGKPVNIRSIILKHGYSKSVARTSSKVTRTKSYIEAIKPLLPQLDLQQQRFVSAIGRKDLDKEKLPALLSGFDILTKNKQLLSGKATENVAIKIEISEKLAGKYDIQPSTTTTQTEQPVKSDSESAPKTA